MPVRVDPKGIDGPTWKVANGPRYRRVSCGLYVPEPRPDHPEQRIVEAAARLAPDGSTGAVTGWASLRWRGGNYFDGKLPNGTGEVPVELAVCAPAGNLRSSPGTVISRRYLGPYEREMVDGLPVSTVQRAVFDEICRRGAVIPGVQVVDMAAAARLISALLFAEYASKCNSRNGAPLVREVASLAVDESRSPKEPWLRVVWQVVAGLPQPLVNEPVYDLAGGLIGIPDIFDPVAGVVGEYEGDYHRGQRGEDLGRETDFRNHGLEYFAVVGGESQHVVAQRMIDTRHRAQFLPPELRSWTVVRPAWDPAPETLDAYFERMGMVGALTRMWSSDGRREW